MRALAIFAALMFAVAPMIAAPAYADGIEPVHHPRPHRRVHHRPAPAPVVVPMQPIAAPASAGPEEVTLNNSFFANSSGGVGVDINTSYVGGGTTVIVGAGASASAFAFASASASAHGGGRGWGGHRGGGGGGGCGCH